MMQGMNLIQHPGAAVSVDMLGVGTVCCVGLPHLSLKAFMALNFLWVVPKEDILC